MNISGIKRNRLLVALLALVTVAGAADVALGAVAFTPVPAMVLIVYGAIRMTIGPLSRFIARIHQSIRWKIVAAISLMGLLFFLVAVINFQAMNYMHEELHQIQDLEQSRPADVIPAINQLEDTQHGFLFSMAPFLSVLGALLALALGTAIAVSVIDPVRRMSQTMRRIASGDFSQPVQVHNRDELGELADRINQTAQELATLQEATLADERARALRERITQVTAAQEEERRRISRELHDGLGPSLAAIVNRLRACQQSLRTDPESSSAEIEDIAASLKGHIQDIRHLIHDLRPLVVDQLGLTGALRQQLERFSVETGIQGLSLISPPAALEPFVEVTVFRVVQECLSNVQKHASASEVELRLHETAGGLEATVRDNGRGFDTRGVGSAGIGDGVGLTSMRERAELIGGRINVLSSPGRGCEVTLFVPLRQEETRPPEARVGAHPSPVS